MRGSYLPRDWAAAGISDSAEDRIGWIRRGSDEIHPIPSSLVCWSSGARWRTFRIEEHTSSSGELPEGSFVGHLLALNVGAPFPFEISWSGSRRFKHSHLSGAFNFVPASMPFSASWQGPAKVVLLEFLDDFGDVGEVIRLQPVLNRRDDFVAHLVLALRDLARVPAESGAGYGASLCAALVEHVFRTAPGSPARQCENGHGLSSSCLRLVLEYIDAHLAGEISLGSLAIQAGLSPFHFARRFKRSVGLTPHQYIIHKRMELAQSLLFATELSINDVAFRCGFSQQSHFADTFRRTVGVIPSLYRRLNRTVASS